MFKKSRARRAPELFSGIVSNLGERKLKILEGSNEWQNIFFREITSSIEESLFSDLYADIGRPNVPVRQLVGMLILKEGHGWSDERLFSECLFNLRVMWALGLTNLGDEVPAESTYYDFQVRLHRHLEQQGEDLLGLCFSKLTKGQAERYKVNGENVRMDSKLFNSNIARCTRLQLVIGVLQKFFHDLPPECLAMLPAHELEQLEGLAAKPTTAHTYPLSKEQKEQWLKELGGLVLRLYRTFDGICPGAYQILERLLAEQFEVDTQGQAQPKDKDKIDGGTMQSPHDPDAAYRLKQSGHKKQSIQGFSSNITETCSREGLDLIAGVQTGKATTSDDSFFQDAIQNTETVSGKVANGYTDGAYNSQKNLGFINARSENEKINWYLSNIQGLPGNFDFAFQEDGQLLVTDRRTGQAQVARHTPKSGYRIEDAPSTKSKYRYIKDEIVVNYFRRSEIEAQPEEIRFRRANVESTIHHVFYTLDGQKSKYRGLARNHRFVLCRCFWVNFRRICKFLVEQSAPSIQNAVENTQKTMKNAKSRLVLMFSTLWQPVSRLIPVLDMSRSVAI